MSQQALTTFLSIPFIYFPHHARCVRIYSFLEQIEPYKQAYKLRVIMTSINNSYPQSMSNQVAIVELQEHHIEDAADVVTRSFLTLNTLYKTYSPKYEEVLPLMRSKIYLTIGKGWSFALLENRKLIGVSIQYDLLDYLTAPSMPTDLELFAKLGQAGQVLEKQLDISQLRRGEAIYGMFGVIDPDYANRGYSLSFWWQCFARGKVGGWRYYYSRLSSPVSLKMLKQLGAEVVAEAEVKSETGDSKVWMIRIDLNNPLPNMSMLSAMSKRKSKQPEASL